jgi:hypothetical protein
MNQTIHPTVEDIDEALAHLVELGLIEEVEDGYIVVDNTKV